jgi:PLD-like domain
MAAPNSFTLPAETVAGWASRVAAWRGQRSVDEAARDMDSAAKKAGADGKVTLTRHQIWTWAETMQGAAAKLPLAGADVARTLATELRAILAGGAVPAAPAAAPVPAPAPAPAWATPPAATGYAPSPPVTYLKPPTPALGAGTVRLVAERDLGPAVQALLRGATQEILVLSPWRGGMDTLLPDLTAVPHAVALRLITRAPQPDDPAYHRALADLQRRGVDVAVSPYVHTRMIIVDGQTLLLGAASVPGPATAYSREAALITTDPKAVNDARVHFANVQREVRGPV